MKITWLGIKIGLAAIWEFVILGVSPFERPNTMAEHQHEKEITVFKIGSPAAVIPSAQSGQHLHGIVTERDITRSYSVYYTVKIDNGSEFVMPAPWVVPVEGSTFEVICLPVVEH